MHLQDQNYNPGSTEILAFGFEDSAFVLALTIIASHLSQSWYCHIVFQQSFTIKELVYNAEYKIKVDLTDRWYGETNFLTKFCGNVDERTYTVCADVGPKAATKPPPCNYHKLKIIFAW